MTVGIVIAAAVVLLAAALAGYAAVCHSRRLSRSLEELQNAQRLTQLQLVQAQVNPHFLYNALDSILWLVEADRKQDAVHMLEQLSQFFRTALSGGEDIVSLREEMQHTRSYLEIQQARFRDIMEYEILLPKELWECSVPKLTVQPLVENALYHGIKQKRGKGRIRVVCQEQDGDILITVEDHGAGMTPQRKREVEQTLNTLNKERNGNHAGNSKNENPAGFGLAAVHERIRLYFGAAYGVTLWSEYGEGTRIYVRIPKHISFRKEEETC